MNDWKGYERQVAEFIADTFSSDEMTVNANALIEGRLSGQLRQVDVLIDARFSPDVSRRIIVDAKKHSRKISIGDVEKFEGMMRDCRAEHGFLVCSSGFTEGACRRAQENITLHLLKPEDLESFSVESFELCRSNKCSLREDSGVLIWGGAFGLYLPDGTISIFNIAKCDKCHRFYIWCFGCGEKFYLDNEDEYQCSCELPFSWHTAIADESFEGEELTSVYLVLVFGENLFVVDRKPLS